MLIDNKKHGKLYEVIQKYMSHSSACILTSSFSIFAYHELKKELSSVKSLKLLIGAEIDTSLLTGRTSELKQKNSLKQAYIAKELSHLLHSKIKIKKLTRAQPLNLYLFKTNDTHIAIQGSSPLDIRGLGLASSESIAMNNLFSDKETVSSMQEWFDSIWGDDSATIDITDSFQSNLYQLYKEYTPQSLYFHTIYRLFSDTQTPLSEESIIRTKTGFKETLVWNKLYNFQKDGVLGVIDKLEKHNGCIIADSVGLGKTYEALAVIKYYELRNDKVLVLCPKKLRENWSIYTINDKRNVLANDRFNYDVLNHTDLSRDGGKSGEIDLKTINWGNYDLVVIDESHNFRNNNPLKQGESRYSKLMNQIIKSGVKTKVLMLSATPVNNRLGDLKNQIAFITEANPQALESEGIANIDNSLRIAQQRFAKWQKLDSKERSVDNLLEMLNFDYFKILDTLTIARSRKHIQKYYDTSLIGAFPKRLPPINIKPDIDSQNSFPPLLDINKTIRKLSLAAYSPIKYVYPYKAQEYSDKYDITVKSGNKFKQADREQSLVHLMRVNLLKRMESSIVSFTLTLQKLIFQIDSIIQKLDSHEDMVFESNKSIMEIDEDDETLVHSMIGDKVKVIISDIDTIKWREDLNEDKEKLLELLGESQKISTTRDEKLKKLIESIEHKIKNPLNDNNKKVIIFTAFADTAHYLYDNLSEYFKTNHAMHSSLITGSGTNKTTLKQSGTDLNSLLTNFSPRSKERAKIDPNETQEIDILIATDCISEGQNLQDCDYLVNYDIHWNPVRIIQRFGRIDRLGSTNKQIQLVNFWPNMELDEYINLEARVSGRMVLLDISATGEENIIDFDETKQMNDLEYRRNQLKQLQDQVVDIEELSGGISITDLTLNDIRMDLLHYQKEHKEELDFTPNGIFSLISQKSETTPPSVIFCIKSHSEHKTTQTALEPYFLVHIGQDGAVLHHYTHSKKILDILRANCKSNDVIDKKAIDEFTKETDGGKEMKQYQELFKLAVESIVGKKQEAGVQSLFSRGGTAIDKGTFRGMDEFEVISFLIIRGDE